MDSTYTHLQTIYQVTNTYAKDITPNIKNCNRLAKKLSICLKDIYNEPKDNEYIQRQDLIEDLLKPALKDYRVKGSSNIDIAISNYGPDPSIDTEPVRVIIEYKKPTEKEHMMSTNIHHLNVKSFQELIQYYLGQRTGFDTKNNKPNVDPIIGIVTNGFCWFILTNRSLYRYFGRYARLKNEYKKERKTEGDEFIRDGIISKYINKAINKGIKIGYFNLDKMTNSEFVLNKKYLTLFYRFLSPQNLLSAKIGTEANELDKNFYEELLYLMGLKEVKPKNSNSKIITVDTSQDSTLVNNIMGRLNDQYPGLTYKRKIAIAIQLSVTWMNRLLFLKLLESQLYNFNHKKQQFKFLNAKNLKNFNDVYDLFFDVFAKHYKDRTKRLKSQYGKKLPYLNSSLFEFTSEENKYLNVNDIGNRKINIYKNTSINSYKKLDSRIKEPILQYILKFLDDHNFTMVSNQNVNTKSDLINASVLGLIFEKINGFKYGAYFTPGWICMRMAHKSIRRAILSKVNQKLHKKYTSLKNVRNVVRYGYLDTNTPTKIAKKVNDAINSIRICDPSVGSGHFLVSALNELISIKSSLGVLFDLNGNIAKFKCYVQNDELVTCINNKPYHYHRYDADDLVQRSLFHEKKYLIENCLFGVDINPESVEICRLRLWIELLKNAYYYKKNGIEHFTTMPNIDINIKAHNSLVYCFPIHSGSSINQRTFNKYYNLIKHYKETSDKNKEKIYLKKIQLIKNRFNESIYTPDRESYKKNMRNARNKMNTLGQGDLSETKAQFVNRMEKYYKSRAKYKKVYKQYKKAMEIDPYYNKKNGMEWRTEFPEVTCEQYDEKTNRYVNEYKGFDLIIGNPPYIFSRNKHILKYDENYFRNQYNLICRQIDTYQLFIELSWRLLNSNGVLAYIIPNNILTIASSQILRNFLIKNTNNLTIINSKDHLFRGANVDNCIMYFNKNIKTKHVNNMSFYEMKHHDVSKIGTVNYNFFGKSPIFSISMVKYQSLNKIFNKVNKNPTLNNFADVRSGIIEYTVGKGIPKITKKIRDNKIYNSNHKIDKTYKKLLDKKSSVNRYSYSWSGQWIKYGKNLSDPRSENIFKGPRLLARQIPNNSVHSISACYVTENDLISDRNFMIIRNCLVDPLFLLGVINSKIESIWSILKYDKLERKNFPQFKVKELRTFPIPKVNKYKQSKLSNLVHQIMAAISNKDLSRRNKLDNKIDLYVMKLYGLNRKERMRINKFQI